jgi:histidinol-phosphatase
MMSDLLAFATDSAQRAGAITLQHYQTRVATELKADHSPVTIADREAEQFLRGMIAERFPQDGILGEEYGAVRAGARRRWILDPIDGTRSFVRGVPLFGCMVALEADGEAILGVLHFPALNETVCAERGQGCWWNGKPAAVSDTAELKDALLLTTDVASMDAQPGASGWHALRAQAGMTRTWGDCYGYALVATGRAEIMIDPVASVWDTAALQPIIDEAGGVFTDRQGRRTHAGGSAIATNAALAAQARKYLVTNAEDR